MKLLIKFLAALAQIRSEGNISYKKNDLVKDSNRQFQIEDRVKKQIFVGYTFLGKQRFEVEEFLYGKIVYIENNYASIKYRHNRDLEMERLSDLIHVSDNEWKYFSNL